MVTLIYFMMMGMVLTLIVFVDIFLYQSTFINSLFTLYKTSVGSGKWIMAGMWFCGLLMSIIADYRRKKKKTPARGI